MSDKHRIDYIINMAKKRGAVFVPKYEAEFREALMELRAISKLEQRAVKDGIPLLFQAYAQSREKR